MLMLGCKELKQISYLPYKACPTCCSPYIPYGADQENLSKKNSVLHSFFDNPFLYSCDPQVRYSWDTVRRN